MKLKIAIFTPENSYSFIKKSLENIECDIRYIFYNELEDLVSLYNEMSQKMDAIITSGPLGYNIIKNNTVITTPLFFFELKKYEVYKNLFEILLKKPDIDFSKTYIDFIDSSESEDFFKDIIFPNNQKPVIFQVDFSDSKFYEKTKKRYKELLENNRVQFVFTRISNLIPFLENLGIEYKFIFPSEDSIRTLVVEIIKDLKTLRYENRNIVVGRLKSWENLDLVKEYLEKKFRNFIIQKQNGYLEIITLKNEFLLYNDGYYGNKIGTSINFFIKNQVALGFGCSYDIETSRLLAEKAIKKCISSDNQEIFLFDNENTILLNSTQVKVEIRENSKLIDFLESLNLSNINAKKLIIIAKENQKVTAESLSFLLNTSKRTANRILNKLEDNNLVTTITLKTSRGRPIKEYLINLLDKKQSKKSIT